MVGVIGDITLIGHGIHRTGHITVVGAVMAGMIHIIIATIPAIIIILHTIIPTMDTDTILTTMGTNTEMIMYRD